MNIQDIYSGTVMGSFPDDLRSGQEKRRERRKKERQDRRRKILAYLHLTAIEMYSLPKNTQNQRWQWLRSLN